MTLLSIDFDFLFPSPEIGNPRLFTDWGHRECPLFIEAGMWEIRAAQFYRAGVPLPDISVTAVEQLLARFEFIAGAPCYVSETHLEILEAQLLTNAQVVWNYDAHHDAGYDQDLKTLDCGNWALYLATRGVAIHHRYPEWRKKDKEFGLTAVRKKTVFRSFCYENAGRKPPRFDAVFVCRSGAWVPAWCDDAWTYLLSRLSRGLRIEHMKYVAKPRGFSAMRARAGYDAEERLRNAFAKRKEEKVLV